MHILLLSLFIVPSFIFGAAEKVPAKIPWHYIKKDSKLQYAAKHGMEQTVRALLDAKEFSREHIKKTLYAVAKTSHTKIAEILLQKNINAIHYCDYPGFSNANGEIVEWGTSLLIVAATHNQLEMTKLLLAYGANPAFYALDKSKSFSHALAIAAEKNYSEVAITLATALQKRKQRSNEQNTRVRRFALEQSFLHNDTRLIKILAQSKHHGSDIEDLVDSAIKKNDIPMASTLTDYCSDHDLTGALKESLAKSIKKDCCDISLAQVIAPTLSQIEIEATLHANAEIIRAIDHRPQKTLNCCCYLLSMLPQEDAHKICKRYVPARKSVIRKLLLTESDRLRVKAPSSDEKVRAAKLDAENQACNEAVAQATDYSYYNSDESYYYSYSDTE